jgi:sec-independent protein translocase protein TatB
MAIPAPIEMSSLGMADTLILMILALVVFGPRKLPQIGRQIGKLMYEFRKASNDFKFQMEEELRMAEDADRRQKEEAQRQQALIGQAAVSAPAVAQALPAESLEDPTVEKMPEVAPPRLSIQPPSTGETIAAAGFASGPHAAEPVVEANIGADEAGAGETAEPQAQSTPATETVSQHG